METAKLREANKFYASEVSNIAPVDIREHIRLTSGPQAKNVLHLQRTPLLRESDKDKISSVSSIWRSRSEAGPWSGISRLRTLLAAPNSPTEFVRDLCLAHDLLHASRLFCTQCAVILGSGLAEVLCQRLSASYFVSKTYFTQDSQLHWLQNNNNTENTSRLGPIWCDRCKILGKAPSIMMDPSLMDPHIPFAGTDLSSGDGVIDPAVFAVLAYK